MAKQSMVPAKEQDVINLPTLMSDKVIKRLDDVSVEMIDATITTLDQGTPQEQLQRCKGILRGTLSIEGFRERISALAGAVFARIESEDLWRYEYKPDKNGKVKVIDDIAKEKTDYKDAKEYLTLNFPFSPERIKQLINAYEYRVHFLPPLALEFQEMGLDEKAAKAATPQGETDVRHSIMAENAVRKFALDEANKGKVISILDENGEEENIILAGKSAEGAAIANRLARYAGLQVFKMGLEADQKSDKPKGKPSHNQLDAARKELLTDWGVIERKEKDGGAIETTSKPVPESVTPKDVSVVLADAVKRMEQFLKIYREFLDESEKLPDGPERNAYFDMLAESQGERLANKANDVEIEARAFKASWDFWHGKDSHGKPVKPKKIGGVDVQHVPADPALEGFKPVPKKGKTEGASAKA